MASGRPEIANLEGGSEACCSKGLILGELETLSPPSPLPLLDLEKSEGTLRRVLGDVKVGWEEGNVLELGAECFVQRNIAPSFPEWSWGWRSSRAALTGDKTLGRAEGEEWPPATGQNQ